MKIAYARTQFWFNLKSGGSVGHTLGVLKSFRKNKCNLRVLSNEAFFGIDDFNYEIARPLFKRPNWLAELLYNLFSYQSFKRKILKYRPDFIYHRFSGYTYSIAKISKILKIPLILEFNSFDSWKILNWEVSNNPLKRIIQKKALLKIVRQIEDYNLRQASTIIVVSEPLKRDLVKIGIPEDKIIVNYNGVELEKFNPVITESKRCREIRNSLGLEKKKTIVGFSGTFGPWHGIPQLTEAIYTILRNKLSDNVQFVIIGDGGKLKDDMGKRLSKYNEVIFTGMVPYDAIQYYLAICDVLVSPHCLLSGGKEFFGSPTKLFEYMAMGKGIVASDLGQIGEVLEDNKTAILVKPENIEELIDGILKMVNDKTLRERLGREARNTVMNNYTWDKNIERLLERIN